MTRNRKESSSRKTRPKASSGGMSFWERLKLTFHVLVTLILLVTVGGLTYAYVRLKKAAEKLPTLEKLSNQVNYGVTEIYATNIDPSTGYYVRLAKIRDRYQESIPFALVPDTVKQCTVAIEDERFYNHAGLDAKGIARALYTNFKAGGASKVPPLSPCSLPATLS
jgi:membrane peptidoglycan carboxypeptidase